MKFEGAPGRSQTIMKITGTVRYQDLEGGLYFLETSDGKRYLLDGGDDALRQDGLNVEVEGEVTEAMGIGMTGDPVLVVASYAAVS